MGVISLVMSIVIALNIAELSPQLRAQIHSAGEHLGQTAHRVGGQPRARDLVGQRRIWAHTIGISLWLVLYLTLAMYGPTMLVDSFGVSAADASAIMSAFWVFDLAVLIVVGRLSDRLQVRKPFMVGGTVGAVVVTAYLIMLMGENAVPTTHLMITGALLGCLLAVAYGPWMASFSEDADEADPRLQGTAWGIFGFASRMVAVLVLLAVPATVAAGGWQVWLAVAVVCLALFIPAVVFFGGPWRRPLSAISVLQKAPAVSIPAADHRALVSESAGTADRSGRG